METEEIAETLDLDSTLTRLIAPEYLHILSRFFSGRSKLTNQILNRSSSV
jgi:hypothetical protein